jgi:translation initiation factor IF-1
MVTTGRRTPPQRRQDESKIVMEGVIKDTLPNAYFNVELDGGHQVLVHLGGKMRKNYIRCGLGDRVQVELSPYDLTRGRIIWKIRT